MPIVANPAAPFAPKINEKFAASEQFNKIFPTLAGLYEAAGRNYTSASAQTAQNQTSASAVSAGLQARKQEQDANIEAQREEQFRQIAAAKEMQARQQQFEMARMSLPITRQEEADNAARMNGLVEIERQLREKILTPEQAGDARLQLMTQVKAFDNRFKSQQAAKMEQETQMQRKAFDDNQKNIVLAQSLGKQTAGANWIPIQQANGDMEFYGYDATGKYYQIGKKSAASDKPEKPAGKYADETGEFSYKKALPELKAEAEIAYPVKKEAGADGKGSVDVNEQSRADYIQTLARREEENHRKAVQQRQQGQQAPVTAPQQGGQNDQTGQQVDPEIAKLQAKGLPPQQLQFATQVVGLMRTLIEKGKTGELSPTEKAQLAQTIEQYKSFQR
jgi:hypothetical protein